MTRRMEIEAGWRVLDQLCPKCRRESVVYNGNYYCEREQECGWVMKEGHTVKRIVVAYLRQCWEAAKEAHDVERMERMEAYLADYGTTPLRPGVEDPAPERRQNPTLAAALGDVERLEREVANLKAALDQSVIDRDVWRRKAEGFQRAYEGQRRATANAWSHWLKAVMTERFDDGTGVLEYVLSHDPELAARFRAAFGPNGPRLPR